MHEICDFIKLKMRKKMHSNLEWFYWIWIFTLFYHAVSIMQCRCSIKTLRKSQNHSVIDICHILRRFALQLDQCHISITKQQLNPKYTVFFSSITWFHRSHLSFWTKSIQWHKVFIFFFSLLRHEITFFHFSQVSSLLCENGKTENFFHAKYES